MPNLHDAKFIKGWPIIGTPGDGDVPTAETSTQTMVWAPRDTISDLFVLEAGEAIGGQRIVRRGSDGKAYYADNTESSHALFIVGVSTGAAIQGAEVIVQGSGEMDSVSWSWDLTKPLFCGQNGLFTQTVPSGGFILFMGAVLSQTAISLRIGMPIFLV